MNKLIICTFAAILSVASFGVFAADGMTHDAMAKTQTGMNHMQSSTNFSDLYHGH